VVGSDPAFAVTRGFAAALALVTLACDAPPRGEALLVIDTDMPVPKIVDTLRVDVYSADGSTWWVSRDIYLPEPASWPVSFSVYTDDMNVGASALVRLRAYRSEYVQDYRGEGTLSLPALGSEWTPSTLGQCCTDDCTSLCPRYWDPATSALPRLLDDQGQDVTPDVEPQPLVTIDRLVLVNLVPGVRGKVSVTLAGACDGTQAVLPDPSRDDPQPSDLQTCVDTERTLVPVAPATLDPDMTLPAPGSTAQGQFEAPFATDCANAPRTPTPGLFDDEVCVRGGVMIFGSASGEADVTAPAIPRIAAVPSFLMNEYEYSVARFVKARDKVGQQVANYNDGPSNDATKTTYPLNCTGYDVPDPSWATADRNAEPLNCVEWIGARKLCQLDGGDLPTEAQWEWAESAAGRPTKSFVTFAQPLACSEVAYGRGVVPGMDECFVKDHVFGPARVDFGTDVADVADGGLVGMTGNVSEYVLDAAVSMASNCWLSAPIASPSCVQPGAAFIMRAASWDDSSSFVSAAGRVPRDYDEVEVSDGFRCVR